MASNVSSEKLLFYAAAGALGGFAAWGLAEPILGIRSVYGRDILFGALIGSLFNAFLASFVTEYAVQSHEPAGGFLMSGRWCPADDRHEMLVCGHAFSD